MSTSSAHPYGLTDIPGCPLCHRAPLPAALLGWGGAGHAATGARRGGQHDAAKDDIWAETAAAAVAAILRLPADAVVTQPTLRSHPSSGAVVLQAVGQHRVEPDVREPQQPDRQQQRERSPAPISATRAGAG